MSNIDNTNNDEAYDIASDNQQLTKRKTGMDEAKALTFKMTQETEAKTRIAKKLFLAGTGGGGKTTSAQAIASVAAMKGIELNLFDADPANLSIARYNPDLPEENRLEGDTADEMEEFLEKKVFSQRGHALVDLGANKEEAVVRWFADRGAAVVDQSAIIIPINKIDGIFTASRIIDNTTVPVLLMLNGAGGRVANAIGASAEFATLMQKVHGTIVVPDLGRTMYISHATSTPLHVMATTGNAFDKMGALRAMREFELLLAPYPTFRFW
jgi:hypothetical protein